MKLQFRETVDGIYVADAWPCKLAEPVTATVIRSLGRYIPYIDGKQRAPACGTLDEAARSLSDLLEREHGPLQVILAPKQRPHACEAEVHAGPDAKQQLQPEAEASDPEGQFRSGMPSGRLPDRPLSSIALCADALRIRPVIAPATFGFDRPSRSRKLVAPPSPKASQEPKSGESAAAPIRSVPLPPVPEVPPIATTRPLAAVAVGLLFVLTAVLVLYAPERAATGIDTALAKEKIAIVPVKPVATGAAVGRPVPEALAAERSRSAHVALEARVVAEHAASPQPRQTKVMTLRDLLAE